MQNHTRQCTHWHVSKLFGFLVFVLDCGISSINPYAAGAETQEEERGRTHAGNGRRKKERKKEVAFHQ